MNKWQILCNTQAAGVHQGAGSIDPQTEADRSCQHCIISSLQKQFPNVHIFGEEVAPLLIYLIIIYTHVVSQENSEVVWSVWSKLFARTDWSMLIIVSLFTSMFHVSQVYQLPMQLRCCGIFNDHTIFPHSGSERSLTIGLHFWQRCEQ